MVTKYVKHEISRALLLLPMSIKKVHNNFFQYDVSQYNLIQLFYLSVLFVLLSENKEEKTMLVCNNQETVVLD